ncbi:hypothetical protein F4778DRAFT_716756 [Xylariomycetidae sp. FL2044]|nr:hypothetical protein F4778DRAFT_716756 [Xylariomycetidae sp. FL2044]
MHSSEHHRVPVTVCCVDLIDRRDLSRMFLGKTIKILLQGQSKSTFLPVQAREPVYIMYDYQRSNGTSMTEIDIVKAIDSQELPSETEDALLVYDGEDGPRPNAARVRVFRTSISQIISLRKRFKVDPMYACIGGKRVEAFCPQKPRPPTWHLDNTPEPDHFP